MKKIVLFFLLLQGVVMSQSIEFIDVNNIKIPVIYEKQTSLPIVSMQIIFVGAGSIADKNLYGISRFSSKILSEGTSKLGSSLFAKALEEKAISLDVSSGSETLVYNLSSLKEEFDFGLKMLKDLFEDPNFTDDAFLKVKVQTLGLISSKESDFDYIASTKLRSLMFENTSLGGISVGTKDSIENITKQDVKDFITKYINLNNMIVVVGGDIEKQKAFKNLKHVISNLNIGEKNEFGYFNASNLQKTVIQVKDTEQAYIYFGSPLYVKYDSNETYKARVAGFILGEGGFGSRLMEEIRVKKGLAYSAYSRFSIDKTSSGMFGYLQTKNQNKDDAIRTIKEVLKDFSTNGVTQEELTQAKNFLLGSEPLRVETLSQRLSRSFSEYYQGFKLGYSKEELKKIETLTLEELNSFIISHQEINELTFSIVTNDDNKSKR